MIAFVPVSGLFEALTFHIPDLHPAYGPLYIQIVEVKKMTLFLPLYTPRNQNHPHGKSAIYIKLFYSEMYDIPKYDRMGAFMHPAVALFGRV